MPIRLGRSRALVLLSAVFAAVALYKARVFVSHPLAGGLDPGGFVPHWPVRVLACSLVLAAWAGFHFGLRSLAQALGGRVPAHALLFSAFGWSLLAAFSLEFLKVELGPTATSLVIGAPNLALLAIIGMILVRTRGRTSPGDRKPAALSGRFETWARRGVGVLAALISFRLIAQFLRAPLLKGAATGDELAHWWTATRTLEVHGFTALLHGYVHYPGYPVTSAALLAPVPLAWAAHAEPVLPVVFSFFFFMLLLGSSPRSRFGLGRFVGAGVAFCFLILQHGFISAMMLELWYSESLAILVIAALFLVTDLDAFRHESWALKIPLLFGIGAICKLGKPPLAQILDFAVLPTLVLTRLLLDRRPGARIEAAGRGLCLLSGSLAAGWLWHEVAGRSEAGLAFDPPLSRLLEPDFTVVTEKVLPFVWAGYRSPGFAFAMFGAIALLHRPRRTLPALLASLGLGLSIIWLYATSFRTIEYMSSGRYLLHGAYGFSLYFLSIRGGFLLRLLRRPIALSGTRTLSSASSREAEPAIAGSRREPPGTPTR